MTALFGAVRSTAALISGPKNKGEPMKEFTVAYAFDVTGNLHPPHGGTAVHNVGISPGTKGIKHPNGSVEFALPAGRTLTVDVAPPHLDQHII